MYWLPHTTVATVVENDHRFLLVRELADGATVYNQPAGHLDEGESLCAAAIRETLEETRWEVRPTALTGLYQYRSPHNGVTYMRHCFAADPVQEHADRPLDTGILDAHWLTLEEVRGLEAAGELRSPMVRACIEDYLDGARYPLDLIKPVCI